MKRKADFGDGDFRVTEGEIEVAEALLLLPFRQYSRSLLPHWGGKRRRSATRKRPRFPTRKRPRTETRQKPQFRANAMRSSPSSPFGRRSYDMHELYNSTRPLPRPISQLSLRLNLDCNQEKKITQCGPSSADADPSKSEETPGSSNDFQRTGIPYSSGSEEGFSTPAMDIPSSCLLDLNAPPTENLFDSIKNDMDEQIALPVNKSLIAAEARKRRIELRRMKSLHSNKLRLR